MKTLIADIQDPNNPNYTVSIHLLEGPRYKSKPLYEVTYPRPDLKDGRGPAGHSETIAGALVIAASHFNEVSKKTNMACEIHDVSCIMRILGCA
jgi:hypothetical protein